jgi:Leucine-rich repeat (LRR) protein
MLKYIFILLSVFYTAHPGVLAQEDTTRIYTSLELALRNPDRVERLDLTKTRLDTFPAEIFQLKNLRELRLAKNKIPSIPPQIAQLQKLEILDVSRNKLTGIPVELFSCVHLKQLILNQNLIPNVPREIAHLQELEYLDLWSNELETLPQEISKCKRLKEVDLRVININTTEQKHIQQLLPKAKVYMSPSCNCSH